MVLVAEVRPRVAPAADHPMYGMSSSFVLLTLSMLVSCYAVPSPWGCLSYLFHFWHLGHQCRKEFDMLLGQGLLSTGDRAEPSPRCACRAPATIQQLLTLRAPV